MGGREVEKEGANQCQAELGEVVQLTAVEHVAPRGKADEQDQKHDFAREGGARG